MSSSPLAQKVHAQMKLLAKNTFDEIHKLEPHLSLIYAEEDNRAEQNITLAVKLLTVVRSISILAAYQMPQATECDHSKRAILEQLLEENAEIGVSLTHITVGLPSMLTKPSQVLSSEMQLKIYNTLVADSVYSAVVKIFKLCNESRGFNLAIVAVMANGRS